MSLFLSILLGTSDVTKADAIMVDSFVRTNTTTMTTEKVRHDGHTMALRGGNVLLLSTVQIAKDMDLGVAWVEQGVTGYAMDDIHCVANYRGATMVRAQGRGTDLVAAQADMFATLMRTEGVVSYSKDRSGTGSNGHHMVTRNTTTRMYISQYVMKVTMSDDEQFIVTFVGYADVR